jgi:LmbE family N-acetylglucosaminyl deacetylase
VTVLIISVHPDDETLGCGGAILRHVAAGDEVHWVIVTQGYEPRFSPEVQATKAAEVERVAAAYGMKQFYKLGFHTTKLDHVPQNELIDGLRKVIHAVRPQIVYQIHGGDIHTDHFAVFTAAMSVLKPFYMRQQGVQRVLCYETLSSTEAAPPLMHRLFVPTVYIDITPYLERKLEIMLMFASEIHQDPLPRGSSAIRALARYRGATVATEYAEAFMLIRELN